MLYIVTGAAGHLGYTIAQRLLSEGCTVRALVLPRENCDDLQAAYPGSFTQIRGNVCDPASLEALFQGVGDEAVRVIHCAGLITIYGRFDKRVYHVNVEGTKNIVALCKEHGVEKLVYVSSVHALPELPKGRVAQEIRHFSTTVLNGCYARTKAEASQAVLDAAKEGLDAVIVQPAGIIGPSRSDSGNMTHLIRKFLAGHLPAAVRGGFDFVDVRDVADGAIAASRVGRSGECYILSNRFISLKEFFDTLAEVSGAKKLKVYLPLWIAKAFAPFSELYYRMARKTPLFTPYSLRTLSQNALYSHEKADKELGYHTRSLKETLTDTVAHILTPRKRRQRAHQTSLKPV